MGGGQGEGGGNLTLLSAEAGFGSPVGFQELHTCPVTPRRR